MKHMIFELETYWFIHNPFSNLFICIIRVYSGVFSTLVPQPERDLNNFGDLRALKTGT